MKETELSVLARSPLFTGVPVSTLTDVLAGAGHTERFAEGSEIPAITVRGKRLGVVLSGTVAVIGSGGVPLNRITGAGLFGVASLFGDGACAPTRLFAKKASTVFFLTEEELETLTADPRIRRNLLSFLCDRIRFLNRKVATFSASDATEKVALYLAERSQGGRVTVEGGLAQLARALDLGRASLYRALDRLEKEGAIRRNGRVIEILNDKPETIDSKTERRKNS